MNRTRSLALTTCLGLLCTITFPSYASALLGRNDKVPAEASRPVLEAAQRNPTVRAHLEHFGPGEFRAEVHRSPNGQNWAVDYFRGKHEVLGVALSGSDLSLMFIRYTKYAKIGQQGGTSFGGRTLNSMWLWALSSLIFFIALVPRKLVRSWYALDVLALLSFGVSHSLYTWRHVDASILAAYPPLLYLAARSWWFFASSRGNGAALMQPDGQPPTSIWARLNLRELWLLSAAAVLVRYVLLARNRSFVDVAVAGYRGAGQIMSGHLPYGPLGDLVTHGDTYGPLNYFLYVPGYLLGRLVARIDHITAVQQQRVALVATMMVADIVCALLLALIVRRWSGDERAAPIACIAWAMYPMSTFLLVLGFNDILVAAFILAALAVVARPRLRGALIACAAAVKFIPILLLGVFACVRGERRWRSTTNVLLGAGAVALVFLVYIAGFSHGLHRFWTATIDFETHRRERVRFEGLSDLPTAWNLLHVHWLSRPLEIVCAMTALLAVWLPRNRSRFQIAAGSAAILLTFQIVAEHWWYNYLAWSIAPVLVMLLIRRFGETGSRTEDSVINGEGA